MTRDILFRGKRLDNGKWIEGGYAKVEPPPVCFAEDTGSAKIYIVAENERILADLGMPRRYAMYEVDPSTVGQYTGLTDKAGQKIFEGDFVRVYDCLYDRTFVGVVHFEGACFGITTEFNPHNRWQDYSCEVIDNIHDGLKFPEPSTEDKTDGTK